MPVQVFDNEYCTFSSLTSGIMYAIHNGASVVNVSVGPNFNGLDMLPDSQQRGIADTMFKNEEAVWRRIINVANEHNVIIVFAVGNNHILATIPPENRTNYTINVAAVDSNIRETDFTNHGEGSNISAPGQGILSSVPRSDYAVFDGTSMAAPIVAGTVALMRSCDPDITVSEVLHILQRTGELVSSRIPPMVQVDDALIALTTGVFPDRSKDVGNVDVTPDNDGSTPGTGIGTAPGKGDDVVPGNGGGGSAPGSGTVVTPGNGTTIPVDPGAGDDYERIRRLIEEYKRKIAELEKLLPENK
jgi:subtilisin family serine protease